MIKKIINPDILFFIFTFFIYSLILIYNNFIPYYNDDISFISTLEKISVIDATHSWINHYGLIYRPVGVFLSYLIYNFLYDNLELFYLLNLSLYFLCSFQIYLLIKQYLMNDYMSKFVSIFFLLFPLNITAYLQIPSLMTIIAINLFLLFLKLWLYSLKLNNNSLFILSIFLWFFLNLIYEQLITMLPIILLIVIWVNKGKIISYKNFKFSFGITLISMTFIVLYFSTNQNPKIIALLNTHNIQVGTQIQNKNQVEKNDIEAININRGEKNINRSIENKLDQLFIKISKTYNYLLEAIKYSLANIVKHLFFYLPIILIFLVFLIYFFLRDDTKNVYFNVYYMIFGGIWFFSSISPFLLYEGIQISPYVFVLPSIGLGIIIFTIFSGLLNFLKNFIYRITLNVSMVFVLFIFFISHIGYYHGIKEEFDYWQKSFDQIKPNITKLLTDKEITYKENFVKNNSHIFWFEKFIGARYIQKLINDEIKPKEIVTPYFTKKKNSITIKIPK